MIAASRGKPWNDVFAARIRIPNVKTWTTQNMKWNEPWLGNVASAISESTETVPLGRAPIFTASHETPRKRVIAVAAIISNVFAAFDACGRLNALTPFAIASTPVNALDPE